MNIYYKYGIITINVVWEGLNMKKKKNIIIASVVAVAFLGFVTVGITLKNKMTDVKASNSIENNIDEQENNDEIANLILNGDEKFKIEDYSGALKDYESAFDKIKNDEDLKVKVTEKIEDAKSMLKKAEKGTETTTFENTKQKDTTNEENVNSGNSADVNNSNISEKQTEATTQATTIKETTTQSTTKKQEISTIKKEPVIETTTKAQSSNNTSTKQPNNNIPKGESLDELLKESGWSDEDIANSGGGTAEVADFEITGNVIGH